MLWSVLPRPSASCSVPQFPQITMIPAGLFEPLMTAGEGALGRVLVQGDSRRTTATADHQATANELLAADAFVTWAFEAAAEEPETISPRADAAMRRVSDRAVPFLEPR